jgi:NADPH:quinone reductase-like Zn-dependent oxidoreductase
VEQFRPPTAERGSWNVDITAAVLEEYHRPLRVQDLRIDEPRAGEVLVRTVATGVCHTDAIARDEDLPFPVPGVLGHEGAGVVEAVGGGASLRIWVVAVLLFGAGLWTARFTGAWLLLLWGVDRR